MIEPSRGSAGAPAPLTGPGAPCQWGCGQTIPDISPETGRRTRSDAETCGVVCRKRRNRFLQAPREQAQRRSTWDASAETPMRFAYADPPYPGKAGYYRDQPTYRGEVDHRDLIGRLVAEYWDGWALSTSAGALQAVLAHCPDDVRVCVWRRQVRPTRSRRALSAWEPLIVWRGRELPTDGPQPLVDELQTAPIVLDDRQLADVLDYRGRYDSFPGALIGMKPPEFSAWMFHQLGACEQDTLVDLFPGSGAVGRAWGMYVSLLEQARRAGRTGLPVDLSRVTTAKRAA